MSCVLSLLKQGRFNECWRPVCGRPAPKGNQNYSKHCSLLCHFGIQWQKPHRNLNKVETISVSHKRPQLGGMASVTSNSAEKRQTLSCGPIRAAHTVTSRTKIAAPMPAITSALQGTTRGKKKEKGIPLLFENTAPLPLASHWLELIYIDWETGKCWFYFGQPSI